MAKIGWWIVPIIVVVVVALWLTGAGDGTSLLK